jgi:predicted O-methyltransferase YrrM
MGARRVGTWKDALRRATDAAIAGILPGGVGLVSILAQVDGYLYPHEAVLLYQLARSSPGAGAVVEIGSYRGRSTLCLAKGARARGGTRVYAVDPHVYGTEADLRENLRHFGMDGIVEPVVLPSVEAARDFRGDVRLLFVDGHHEEASVAADLDAWLPKVVPGGFVLVHDSTDLGQFPGPARVARERLVGGAGFDAVDRLGSITWAKLRGGADPWLPPTRAKLLDGLIRSLKRR